jgi:hypothetical protein
MAAQSANGICRGTASEGVSEFFTQALADLSIRHEETAKIRHFFKLARALLY